MVLKIIFEIRKKKQKSGKILKFWKNTLGNPRKYSGEKVAKFGKILKFRKILGKFGKNR